MDGALDRVLSEYWRINKSSVRLLEYTEVLRSLRRVCEHLLGKDTPDFDLKYSTITGVKYKQDGKERRRSPQIEISPNILNEATTFPLADDCFDVICGQVIHEVAHILCGSLEICPQNLLVRKIAELGEEVVADNYFFGRKEVEYINKARDFYLKQQAPNVGWKGEILQDAIQAFVSLVIYKGYLPPGISQEAQQILLLLLSYMRDIHTKPDVNDRMAIYCELAGEIRKILKERAEKTRIADPRGKRLRSSRSKESYLDRKILEEVREVGDLDKLISFPKGTINQEDNAIIQNYLAEEASDVTSLIHKIAGIKDGLLDGFFPGKLGEKDTVIYENKPFHQGYWEANAKLLKELNWLRNLKMTKQTVIKRELPDGKIDKRRLYKIPFTDEVFYQKTRKKIKENITLLMDCSGSMLSIEKCILFEMCASAAAAIPGIEIFGYKSGEHSTLVSRLVGEDNKMKKIPLMGCTPTGDALIFTAHTLMKRGGGLLIHFTDGEANKGIPTLVAYDAIRDKMPNIFLLNISHSSSYLLQTNKWDYPQIQNIIIPDINQFSKVLQKAISDVWGLVL